MTTDEGPDRPARRVAALNSTAKKTGPGSHNEAMTQRNAITW